ncbi:MAG TPA: DUF3108 domain-containing protein [Terriglobales bacterium]|nr:DUF3108 domain-containing protein [Terriglobales bacterium]
MRIFLRSNPAWCLFAILSVSLSQGQATAPSNPPALSTISATPSARIVPPPPNYAFPDGQTYAYVIEWHLFNAGTARVTLGLDGGQQHVTAIAESAGVVNALYKVHDRFEAFFDPRTFCALRVSKHSEESSRSRQTELRFDYSRHKSVLDEKNLKTGEQKHLENDLPSCVTDVVSGFYYVASLPLQPGNIYTFPINDGNKTTEVRVRVEARDQVKVPAGTFQTVRVKAEAISGALQGKGTLWAWFTDDSNHTPVQIRSKLGWGTLLFRLQRIEKQ